MKRYSWRWAVGLAPLCLLVLWATLPATGQAQSYGTQNGEWQTYGGDLKSDRYSPLDQINADNFNKIEVAWRFKTDALGPRPEFNLQATPLMVKGVIYTVGGTRRAAGALDAATGEMLWMHDERGQARRIGASPALGPRPRTGATDARTASST
jgi:quinoprotein glucose dehydrogenase